jgi:hypothetical protein
VPWERSVPPTSEGHVIIAPRSPTSGNHSATFQSHKLTKDFDPLLMRAAKHNAQQALTQRRARAPAQTFDTVDMHFATRARGSLGKARAGKWEKRWIGGDGEVEEDGSGSGGVHGDGAFLRVYRWVRVSDGDADRPDFLQTHMEDGSARLRGKKRQHDFSEDEEDADAESAGVAAASNAPMTRSITAAFSRSHGAQPVDVLLEDLDTRPTKRRRSKFPTETPDSRPSKARQQAKEQNITSGQTNTVVEAPPKEPRPDEP